MKDKPDELLRVVCIQRHLYSTCQSETGTKSAESPLLLGYVENHHKCLSNHVICLEELQNSLGLLHK